MRIFVFVLINILAFASCDHITVKSDIKSSRNPDASLIQLNRFDKYGMILRDVRVHQEITPANGLQLRYTVTNDEGGQVSGNTIPFCANGPYGEEGSMVKLVLATLKISESDCPIHPQTARPGMDGAFVPITTNFDTSNYLYYVDASILQHGQEIVNLHLAIIRQ